MSSSQPQKAGWEEGIALGLLEEMGDPDPPMDALVLAHLCNLRVETSAGSGARLVGDTIYVPAKARHVRQQGLVAHELGHWALANAGEPDSEAGAAYVGAALMLPQRDFSADLRRMGWDLRLLRAKHLNCSAELIARRIVALRDACVCVWDNGKLTSRIWSPWLPEGYRRISRFERELAAQVVEAGETVEVSSTMWGFAVFERDWQRVITVCEAEQLALRY